MPSLKRRLRRGFHDTHAYWRRTRRHAEVLRRRDRVRPTALLLAPLIALAALRAAAELTSALGPMTAVLVPAELELGGIQFGADYGRALADRTVPLVFDRHGRFIGVVPRALVGETEHQPYLAAPTREVPARWWQMVVALEDRYRGTLRHGAGIDWGSFFGIVFDAARLRGLRGGSTLEMQLAKTVHADTDARGLQRVLRKLRDLLHAPLLAHLTRHDLARHFSTHVPLLQSDVHGLELGAFALFERAPTELSLAEEAVLAAAVRYRVPTRPDADHWARLKGRAQLGLQRIEADGHIDRRALEHALAELDAMAPPTPRRTPTCGGRRGPWKPDRRALALAPDALVQAAHELHTRFGSHRWLAELSAVRLGLDVEAHCRVRAELGSAHDRVIRTARARQSRRSRCWVGRPRERMSRDRSSFSFALADASGTLVAFYTDADLEAPVYHGFNLRDGRIVWDYDPALENRKIGSIGKMLVAILAAEEGDCAGRGCEPTRYLQRGRRKRKDGTVVAWFANYDGNTGFRPGGPTERWQHWVTPAQAFGGSDNLALMHRMARGRWPRTRVEGLLDLFELARHPGPQFNPVVDVPMGNVFGSPRTLHRAFQAVGAALAGESGGRCRPGVVLGLRDLGGAALEPARPDPGCAEVAGILDRPSERRFVLDALRGVLEDNPGFGRTVRGTAAAGMGRYAPSRDARVRWHIAKTGSTSSEERHGSSGARPPTSNATFAGAFETEDGRFYSYVAQLRPKGPAHDLGRCVYGGDVAKMVAPVIEMALARELGEY